MRQRLHTAATPARLLIAGACLAVISILMTALIHPAPPADRFDAARGFLLGVGLTLIVLGAVRHIQASRS